MAFTRFHDDPSRIKKQLAESSFPGRYQLDTPGQGLNMPFFEDPNMRLQHWGANLRDNNIHMESDLFGLTRPLNRDHIELNQYKTHAPISKAYTFKSMDPFVQESRATHPAWTYKNVEHTRWDFPLLNPLNGLEKGFHENIQTRIIEKQGI